jgi:hypothetical protein
MATYLVRYGNDGYTPDWTTDDRDDAVRSVCTHKGWAIENVVESGSFSTDYGDAVALYDSQEACDSDSTGAHAPWIVELDEHTRERS